MFRSYLWSYLHLTTLWSIRLSHCITGGNQREECDVVFVRPILGGWQVYAWNRFLASLNVYELGSALSLVYSNSRDWIFKLFRTPGVDSTESIPCKKSNPLWKISESENCRRNMLCAMEGASLLVDTFSTRKQYGSRCSRSWKVDSCFKI